MSEEKGQEDALAMSIFIGNRGKKRCAKAQRGPREKKVINPESIGK